MRIETRRATGTFRKVTRLLSALLFLVLLSLPEKCSSQTSYFPAPLAGSGWETTDPAELGWCNDRIDSLYNFLDTNGTKAFILLYHGRIVLEHYSGTFTQDSLWYWASAGKTLTSTMVGLAQEDGFLDVNEPTELYLGTGWTAETPSQEASITVRNQITMTTGLDDGAGDASCTDPACLTYLADPGDRWAYHNAPYTLLHDVVANAAGQNFTIYFNNRLRNPIGMDGFWIPSGFDKVYYSTARSAARFGLLALNRMVWDTDTIMHDTAYFHAATTPSQNLNQSYGYLWWLNGQPTYMLPQTQFVFQGPLMPNEPPDAYNGLGKNDQLINVVPSRDMVLVRLGNAAGGPVPVATVLNDQIWAHINALDCSVGISKVNLNGTGLVLVPNPAEDQVELRLPENVRITQITVLDATGRPVLKVTGAERISVAQLAPGHYTVVAQVGGRRLVAQLLKE
ncbi:MAG: serine hydrolase [Flavobacteriales bacterium]|jgi:CubicO group peptidase (beta-lactamase class C family)|nr:serine hydrolase [Flavobacteriales bacterium]